MRQQLVMKSGTDEVQNPCQLKKLWGTGVIACTFICAIDNGCPVFYVDSNGMPILGLKRDKQ